MGVSHTIHNILCNASPITNCKETYFGPLFRMVVCPKMSGMRPSSLMSVHHGA